MPDPDRTLDLSALIQGFVEDLRTVARPPSERGDEPPTRGRQQLRQVAEQVRGDRAQAVVEVDDRYRERTEAMQAVLVQRQQRLEAYAGRQRQAVPTAPDRFIVAGRVTDEATGAGLPNVLVRATGSDPRRAAAPVESRTDALGYYRIEYSARDLETAGQSPETLIEVMDEGGEVLFTSARPFVPAVGQSTFVAAAVDGQRVPTSRRLADKVTIAVTGRQQDLARRQRVLDPRLDVPLEAAGTVAGPAEVTRTPTGGTEVTRPAEGRTVVQPAGGGTVVARPIGEAVARPVTEVKGIGPTFRDRLEKEGVTDADTVATMQPARLAAILDVGEGRALNIITAAKESGTG